MKKISLLFTLVVLTTSLVSGQSDKALYSANKYFNIKNYKEALPLFLEVIKTGSNDPLVYYKTGVAYEKSFETDEQVKAIPYFEQALKLDAKMLPADAYYKLGEMYLLNEQLQEASETFKTYLKSVKSPADIKKTQRAIDMVNSAILYMGNQRKVDIHNFGSVINSKYTEYNPVVSADESVMAFTALRPNTGKTRSNEDFIEEIYISYNQAGNWTAPVPIAIVSDYNVGTAGLSADGQQMMVFIGGAQGSGNLYTINKSGDDWSRPVTMGNAINSRGLESTASITPDGKTLYFSSNRPGGFGGMDLYKAEKKENGEWGEAVNLGPKINSQYDEDAPFIHPDMWTLFFTSNGHNTMGGRDIFVTRLFDGEWTKPENMGYPINTTANDNYFTLTADGRQAYFSSDRKGSMGGQDIYTLAMPEEEANIPLTMVKGRILNAETMSALPTKIYMIDNESGKKLDFVYQPDAKTGNYLIILPPAKNYDMIIESEGFLPYTLNINVPGQTYFYELYQEILLKTIKQFDEIVGQSVEVRNAFYDTHAEAVSDMRKTHEATLVQNDSIDVYDLMTDLMAANDEAAIDYLTGLVFMNNPIGEVVFSESAQVEQAKRVYYYDESTEENFEKKVIDGKTIFSLPTMYVTEEAAEQKKAKKLVAKSYNKEILAAKVKVMFDLAKSDLKPDYHGKLDEIVQLLRSHPELGVEISGFASSEGNDEYNRQLSNQRAIAVLDYINQREIVRRRIIARGYGETEDAKGSKEEGRRVELKLIDLSN